MKLTVALPVWNSKKIAWLCMESLARQRDANFEWELIVFEEEHEQQLGQEFFFSYDLGPVTEITYLTELTRYTLGEKWHRIMKESHKESKVFMFCAADNYYHPYMLRDSLDAIEEGHDWFYTTKGYFYDFTRDKVILYDARRKSGLQMAASMGIAQKIPNSPRKRLVDIWLAKSMKPQKPLMDPSYHWRGTLFTNGYNQISTKRWQYFDHVKFPFKETDAQLEDIVPEDIVHRINSMQ